MTKLLLDNEKDIEDSGDTDVMYWNCPECETENEGYPYESAPVCYYCDHKTTWDRIILNVEKRNNGKHF